VLLPILDRSMTAAEFAAQLGSQHRPAQPADADRIGREGGLRAARAAPDCCPTPPRGHVHSQLRRVPLLTLEPRSLKTRNGDTRTVTTNQSPDPIRGHARPGPSSHRLETEATGHSRLPRAWLGACTRQWPMMAPASASCWSGARTT
jgi:hypothetical protein